MTIKELIEKGTPTEKYLYLDGIWWDIEGLLAHLLPIGQEGTNLTRESVYADFQALRFRIHDMFAIEENKHKIFKDNI
jgi:hypothetical protein